MNYYAIKAIYLHEMDRLWRTLFPMPQALGDEKIVAMDEKVEPMQLLTCK